MQSNNQFSPTLRKRHGGVLAEVIEGARRHFPLSSLVHPAIRRPVCGCRVPRKLDVGRWTLDFLSPEQTPMKHYPRSNISQGRSGEGRIKGDGGGDQDKTTGVAGTLEDLVYNTQYSLT